MSSACSLWQNNRGTYVPPFFGVWEGRTYGPCNPLRAVGLRPTTRKFFEKNLTKNFYSPTARAKLANSFLVPTLSKAISSRVSLAIGVAERIIPVPKVL